MIEYREHPSAEGRAAIHAAGAAINWKALMTPETIRAAARLGASVAEIVKPASESEFWQQGHYTGMRIAKFQNWLYEQNRFWRFTDGTLCALWCIEYPDAHADYAERWDFYLPSVRAEYNEGRHQAQCPAVPCVAYDAQGNGT